MKSSSRRLSNAQQLLFTSLVEIYMMSSPPNKQRDIVIAGRSLAGLYAGISLRRLGHNITTLERSPTPLLHDLGVGIGVEKRDDKGFSGET